MGFSVFLFFPGDFLVVFIGFFIVFLFFPGDFLVVFYWVFRVFHCFFVFSW